MIERLNICLDKKTYAFHLSILIYFTWYMDENSKQVYVFWGELVEPQDGCRSKRAVSIKAQCTGIHMQYGCIGYNAC